MEKPNTNDIISVENFNVELQNHKNYLITFKQQYSFIYISILFKEEIFSKEYEKYFSLENLKKIGYFSLFNSIKEIYEEIIFLFKKKTKEIGIIENENEIALKIPLEGLRLTEIVFCLKEKDKDGKQTIKILYSIIKDLKDENKILKSNQEKLEEKIKTLESDIKSLKELFYNSKKESYNISGLNSLIIDDNEKYKTTLKNWINPNSNLKAELLYRLSRDGNSYAKFHDLCDNKGNTLLLVKLYDGDILGGYTTQNWDNSGVWKKDKYSFVFSLTNNKIALNNNESEGHIYCAHYCRGPCFGFFLYFYDRKMNELKIEKNSIHFLKSDELFNKKDDYYKASEVEIFKIIYK